MRPIEDVIPVEKVLSDTRSFLADCGWELEIGESLVKVPEGADLCVQSRAYVLANAPDVLLGNHYEAVVLLGCEVVGQNWFPTHGILKLYFNEDGELVTEDRFPATAG